MLARLGLLRGRSTPTGTTNEAMAASTFDAELLDGVAAFVETDKFLDHLKDAQKSGGGGASSSSPPPAVTLVEPRPLNSSPGPTPAQARRSAEHAAHAVQDDPMASSGVYVVAPGASVGVDGATGGSYVVVSREDAVEAVAYFIAGWLARASPEARAMDPKQLQKALGQTMASLRRARWRAVLGWGRVAVAAASYAASVVLAGGSPPAFYRAVVAALWAAARMAYRAVG